MQLFFFFKSGTQAIPHTCSGPVLVVLDGITGLANMSPHLEALLTSPHTHIIIIHTSPTPPTSLTRDIDLKLTRGCTVLQLEPLSLVHTTQRMVHALLSRRHFAPQNSDQLVLAQLASLTHGCPDLVRLTAELVYRQFLHSSYPMGDLTQLVQPACTEGDRITTFVDYIINHFKLDVPQYFVLQTLTMFGPIPILQSVAARVQTLVLSATNGGCGTDLLTSLLESCLVKVYPPPVVIATSMMGRRRALYMVPHLVCEATLRRMDKMEVVFAIATAHRAVTEELAAISSDDLVISQYCAGMCEGLLSTAEGMGDVLDDSCLEELHRPLVQLACEGILRVPWSVGDS